jgi:ADP-dependent NAD(P)H-hydrate dehydratase / NAD(P)H-hydrate epimerase
MKIVSAAEMREIDRVTSERFGVPSLTLMENAGAAVADFVAARYPDAKRIAVICGKGNNGGDGFVAARKLQGMGREVRVVLLASPHDLRGDAAEMFKKMKLAPLVVTSHEDLRSGKAQGAFDGDLLVDALLGTGFRPPVSGLYAEAISAMNSKDVPTVAVDIPSGADADVMGEQTGTVVRADAIVTFTCPRPAHVFGRLTTGPTVLAPIGSPEEAIGSSLELNLITPRDIASLLGPRLAAANKGSFGHVLVIGGSLGKAGAAAMAGMSVLRSGAGLATVATPKSVLSTVAGFHAEVMTEPLHETEAGTISMRSLEYGYVDQLVKGKTVLAIGPGISRNPETSEFVRTVVGKYDMPTVLDADGLNAFEGVTEKLNGKGAPLVITPHPGEMGRLLGISAAEVQRDRLNIARNFAREHELVVALKGHRTLIAQPNGEVWVNTTGNPGMATGGTGDILTGMSAGMIAQNAGDVIRAVIAAVYLHGLAGDVARETMGEQSLVATDLVKSLPEAMRRVRESAKKSAVSFQG